MSRRSKKKKRIFLKAYIAYVLILLVLIGALVFYTVDIAKKYEQSQPGNYVLNLISHANKEDGSLGEYMEKNIFADNGLGDGQKRSKDFYNKAALSKLEVEADYLNSDNDIFVYNVCADDNPYMTIAIKRTSVETKLWLFNLSEYELCYAYLRNENSTKTNVSLSLAGTTSFTVIYPEDFSLCFDGKAVAKTNTESVVLEEFESLEGYEASPKGIKQSFELNFEPEITVLNNGNEEVSYEIIGDIYYVNAKYCNDNRAKEIIDGNINALKYLKRWAEFSYDDVPGENHGLSKVLSDCHILSGSKLEASARSFAKSIDITFVSNHSGYTFKDEQISNYVYYNDELVSCDVSFNVDYYLSYNRVRNVVFNSRMYFMKQNGNWYWVGQYIISK